MKALIRITALIIAVLSFVSSNAQDFEGVWYPSSNEGMIGNIKIKKENGEYVVQYKTTVGLKTSKGKVVNGALYFDFLWLTSKNLCLAKDKAETVQEELDVHDTA